LSNFEIIFSNLSEQNFQNEQIQTPKPKKRIGTWLNVLLFILTFFSTTLAGVAWLNKDPFELSNFHYGLTYSLLILFFLSCHEFGHYFAAKLHKVEVTLPFYIPFPLILNPFGTMGAVIRMRSPSQTRKALFDIGIAGPVAGFIACLLILIIGMTTLPPFDYIYEIHPEYKLTGVPTSGFSFGNTLLFWLFGKIFASSPDVFLPPMNEVYHYPFLCVGWFGLFVTSLNLLPVGQLDGGHIIYALFGNKHKYIARIFFALIFAMGLLGLLPFAGINLFADYGLINWLVWSLLIFFVIKIEHPPLLDNEPVDFKRKIWGVIALLIFVSSFTPSPFSNF